METLQTNFAELSLNVPNAGANRGQNGRLMIVGKRRRCGVGAAGSSGCRRWYEVRKHKALILGARNEMTRMEAQVLQTRRGAMLARCSKAILPHSPMLGIDASSSLERTIRYNWIRGTFTRYCVDLLDATPLQDIERFKAADDCPTTGEFSKSVVEKFVTWTRAILERPLTKTSCTRTQLASFGCQG